MKSRFVIFFLVLFVVCGLLLIQSCKKNQGAYADPPTPINFTIPPGFPAPTYSFQSNPLTEEGFLLGRKLFYDTRLSIDGTVSCGSCHQPVAAFTTFEHDRSHGVNHNHTLRNAPGLFNLAWYPYFNQDGSAASLPTVYVNHITNPIEMGETVTSVINKIKDDSAYKRMFLQAFGTNEVTMVTISKALTQFLINLVSADTKYDKVMQGKASFNTEEEDGFTVFKSKCETCHSGPLFTDFSLRNIGLAVDPSLNDFGRMRVTGNRSDSLKFRVPGLRNVEFTSYYGHDGRYNLPRGMIEHYGSTVQQSPTLDPLLTNGISLSVADENNLVAFLSTLSDSAFLNNPRFRQ
ncbi:MAG: cytochrome-c peroxidase [Flavisolibacter sp.]